MKSENKAKKIARKISLITISTVCIYEGSKYIHNKIAKMQKNVNQNIRLYYLMNRWTQNLQNGKSIAEWLKTRGYNNVSIYGMGIVSETLISELSEGGVNVLYGIDQNPNKAYLPENMQVCYPDENLPDADIVIVTIISAYPVVKAALNNKLACPIISIEDLVYNL